MLYLAIAFAILTPWIAALMISITVFGSALFGVDILQNFPIIFTPLFALIAILFLPAELFMGMGAAIGNRNCGFLSCTYDLSILGWVILIFFHVLVSIILIIGISRGVRMIIKNEIIIRRIALVLIGLSVFIICATAALLVYSVADAYKKAPHNWCIIHASDVANHCDGSCEKLIIAVHEKYEDLTRVTQEETATIEQCKEQCKEVRANEVAKCYE